MPEKNPEAYLTDHLAGSVMAVDLLSQLESSYRENEMASWLTVGVGYRRLIRRAEEQRRQAEQMRLTAARIALRLAGDHGSNGRLTNMRRSSVHRNRRPQR